MNKILKKKGNIFLLLYVTPLFFGSKVVVVLYLLTQLYVILNCLIKIKSNCKGLTFATLKVLIVMHLAVSKFTG